MATFAGPGLAVGAAAAAAARRPGRIASAASAAALVALLVVQLLAPGVLAVAAPALAVGGLLLGLPHGAVDHMVPFWATGERATTRRMAQVLASYLLVAAAAAAALLVAPVAAVAVFLVVSALHFGRGDVVFAAERDGRPVPPPTRDVALALAHGTVVVGLPVALWSEVSGPVLGELTRTGAALPPGALTVLALAVAALVLVAGAGLARRRRWLELGELALLAAVFALVPPLAAFGVYFGLWHAGRHTSRLVALAAAAHPGRPAALGWAARRYALHAAAPTAVAVGVLALVAATDDASVLAVELAVLIALTFPHVQTVARLDAVAAGR